MSDFVAETGPALPVECPECRPDLDPRGYQAYRCGLHEIPMPKGLDDDKVQAIAYLGVTEAGGDENRRWCEAIHGGKKP